MKKLILIGILSFVVALETISAQEKFYFPENFIQATTQLLSRLNLEGKGLEKVKMAAEADDMAEAGRALLLYYKQRQGLILPGMNLHHLRVSDSDRKMATESLDHTFFVNKGYQPSYNYGEDINWKYWPIHDNELRWQLHRLKWFRPLGMMWQKTRDVKFAMAWKEQYLDWMQKNPLVDMSCINDQNRAEYADDIENMGYAWRQLEVSHRLADQTKQFFLFIDSPAFTPHFLVAFLSNNWVHSYYLCHNYSPIGNHLLFEAQRMIYMACFFPEFKDAAKWREDAIDILNREIKKQVYADGGQFELSPDYHKSSIAIFLKAYIMAKANGFGDEFPQSYLDTTKGMMEFYLNLVYPDGEIPCFSDARREEKSDALDSCKEWLKLFPEDVFLNSYLTNRGLISYTSKGFLDSGFFVFRNHWNRKDGIQMDVKAGPPAHFHCQPDNGTFTLWYNGMNLFPDSGSFIYSGDAEVMKMRNWFRQTQVHNTLTLNNANLEQTASVTKCWKPDGAIPMLVTENSSYKNLMHRRTICFVDKRFFVLIDDAFGLATGEVNIHFNVAPGEISLNKKAQKLSTAYTPDLPKEDQCNMVLQCFTPETATVKELAGWYSPEYRKRFPRKHLSFSLNKKSNPVQFITIIYPLHQAKDAPSMSVDFSHCQFSNELGSSKIAFAIDKNTYRINY